MQSQHILIACIGNIFLGDDAFGVVVAKGLSEVSLPDGVRVVDFGIRGLDLAYALLDSPDVTIFVDATARGGEPGTLYVIEPDLNGIDDADTQGVIVETHGMDPVKVLRMVKSMGGEFKRILIVGCEPATFGAEEGQMGLSELVQAAVGEAVKLIESLIEKILKEHRACATA